ncbi:MAG: LUD domain-containing protein [Deltaproteobacteria bacterium]|jgi:iron-sulfur cluster protein|nr:LUD domain-containing protein [Deltaproteobacteria bacterium]
MKRGRDSRREALEALAQGEAFREEVRAIKLRCLEKQDELIDRFATRARERGTNVFLAKDGAAAIAYVLKLAADRRAKTVAKSKSLTSEEIEVNQPLEAAGMEVIETDLGELIIQKAGEKPFHLVFPAVHKTAGEVAEIFKKATGENVPDDIDAIMKVVRNYLRPIFLNADIGMTGANIGIAETGTITIETNEGNGRLVSSIPDVHICIIGQEKIVETLEDAFQMILAHPISAVGQHLTTYVTMMGGRSPLGKGDGRKTRESHILILDNGRSKMKASLLFSDALNCIRCGACMNICPTYGVVGGHAFGHIYSGSIELLEALGCEVVLPHQRGCGYPYIGYGDLKKARKAARENIRHLAPYVEKGYEIVSTEPTATYCLKVSYPRLMDNHPDAVAVAEHSHEFFKLVELLEDDIRAGEQKSLKGRSYGFHIPCHQRSLGAGSHAIDFLKKRGAQIELIETGTCCGMAGTFGLKKGFLGYELSRAVGEPLFERFKDAGMETIVTESSVCRIHLQEGTGRKVRHPLELLPTYNTRQ